MGGGEGSNGEDSKYHKGGGYHSPYSCCGPKFWSFMILVMMALLTVFCVQQFISVPSLAADEASAALIRPIPLSQFPTLIEAFGKADTVALYFAASWCPMSSKPTKLLGELFGDAELQSSTSSGKAKLAIVYVSSDNTEEDMKQYMKSHWIGVPFDSDERHGLKKHFSVCAKREIDELDMERKYEIPSLFVFDAESHGLLTTGGVKDLEEDGPLGKWQRIQHVARSLADKYAEAGPSASVV